MEKVQYQKIEFFDKDKNGKDRRWKERKIKNVFLGGRLNKLGYKVSHNVLQCAERLQFSVQEDKTLRLSQTWLCKNKLCDICNWRRSMKHSYQANIIVNEAVKREPKGRFLFLTLTVKNIEGSQLNNELSQLTSAFRKLFMRAKVKKNILGFMRATEVTKNNDTGLYHPHLHVLLFVKSSYFTGNDKNYISQKEWTEMWQQSAQLNYVPIVDVRAVKPNVKKGQDNLIGAVLEVAKYPVKSIDVMGKTEQEKLQATEDLYLGLYRKRQLSYGGLFKTIRKELALSDVENDDLVVIEEDKEIKKEQVINQVIAMWSWERQKYFIENDY